jgi:hypothetical protein
MAANALSIHLGFCGALGDTGPRYLPCATQNDPHVDTPVDVPATDNGSEATPVQSGSRAALFDPNMKERKDEIDALRARVDVILNKMVQNSGDDVQRLRQKIAEMRSNTPRASISGSARDALNAPLSPMTAITHATNVTGVTNTTGNSATPSADTEIHGNLTKKSVLAPQNETSRLHTNISEVDEERDDDDDDIDNMEFDFKVTPLSQLVELEGSPPKPCKDPPASLKASESLLPDPGGDESYCSSGSRCDSPPPGSLLYEAAARKAALVVEYQQQEHLVHQQVTTHVQEAQQQKQQDGHREPPSPESPGAHFKEKSTKVAVPNQLELKEKEPVPQVVSSVPSKSSDPSGTPVVKPYATQHLERSKSPPPPVANVNIPRMINASDGAPSVSGGSHSDSSLTRPPSPTPVGGITMVEEVTEQRIRDPYGDKGLYTGVLVKRRPHGRGTMKYDDGRHYEGHWNHGRWHGVGRAIFANNDIFEGSYDMDQRHGHGMYQWNDGRVYTGQFFQDQRQGRGTYTWPDGAVYQGEFKAGHRHGQGMYRFADGSVYTGEWETGKYHGVGEVSKMLGRES